MGFGGRLSTNACSAEELYPLQAGPYYHDHEKNQNIFTLRLIASFGQWDSRRCEVIISGFSLITTRPLGMFGRDLDLLLVRELNGYVKQDFAAGDSSGRR